jgi:hypothetical protein
MGNMIKNIQKFKGNTNNKSDIRNIITLTLLILILTVISGCSQTGTTATYRTGTDGLIFDFSKVNPKSVYEGEEFGTSLFIKNVGSYDIITRNNPAQLTVTYDDYRLEFIQNSNSAPITNIWLHGKNQYYPVGEETPVSFYFNSKRLTYLRESATTSINYNLCFPYQTELTTMTCIDTKTANNDDSAAACTSEPYSGSAGQGAPIVITKIEPEILLQTDYVRPQFKIYIENRGNGYVANTERCDMTNINDVETSSRVTVTAWLSGELLNCGPDNMGEVRVVDSESYIECSLPNTDNKYSREKKNYITPLTVRLSYTYTLIEKQDVEIKRNELLKQDVTQGTCNSYQLEFNGGCITKCEYCAKYPGDTANCYAQAHTANNNLQFQFGPNFGCTCNVAQCNTKLKDGNCLNTEGFCPGGLYCCSNSQCSTSQIESHGQCIDKCVYCLLNPSDTQCVGLNLTGFACRSMTLEDCNKYQTSVGGCYNNLCGDQNGVKMYCANDAKIATYSANNP